ncbi:MAG: gliding motility-associated C-terminal domain-containing protein, partial [Odoribacter sp.]
VYESRNYQNDWDGTGLSKGGYVGHINLINGVYTYVISLGDQNKTVLKSWIEIRANMNRRDYR